MNNLLYDLITVSALRPNTPLLALPQRAVCQPEQAVANLDPSGDVTPYWADHEYRAAAPRVRAATLLVQGFADSQRDPAPFFENLPSSTPRMMLTGWWEHTTPGDDGLHERRFHPEWARADWLDLLTAWFDRYVKGLPVATGSWPRAQVQGSDGQWRAEPDWPVTGGPVGHLALGSDGSLGITAPSGATAYTETLTWRNDLQSNVAVFETRPMPDRLEITGQPILDLWARLDLPDAHVAARLEVLDGAGRPVPELVTVGLRSARHLDPLVRNRFAQSHGRPAPVAAPVRIHVRFDVTDLVVPRGGRLRLTVAGSVPMKDPPSPGDAANYVFDPFLRFSQPSGAGTTVTILHDCAHPSSLRFLMLRKRPDLLNVREVDEKGPLRAIRGPVPVSDAGGLATAPVCGKAPLRLPMFGPPRP
ncbi:MAG: hypothetical protein LC722_05055 [Actinobacteria bacterium]|nr:hypothetical protein [Actinomycetota bacterium]